MRPGIRPGVRPGIVAAGALAVLVGCGSGTSSNVGASGTSSAPTGPTSSATTRPPCPVPHGGACLGKVTAGTYDTALFQPPFEYTLPAGWANDEDTPGNFFAIPPSGDFAGVDGDTSDFIGVYTSVLAHANVCASTPAPGVGRTPAAIMRWFQRDPAFRASPPSPVTIGGLHGLVTTLRMAPGWKLTCPYSHGAPVAPMTVGSSSTFLDHNLVPGQATRLYLLAHDDSDGQSAALAVEVVDIRDAGHLAAYSRIVKSLKFSS
jgi:hypothetical protein